MRRSHLDGILGLALLGLIMSAGAAMAAGNPCSPLTYGAVGDGTVGFNTGTLNTVPIQSAIDACAARGGGIVALNPVPSGKNIYLTGPIQLKSHVYLAINAGVTLLATTDQGQYSIAYINYPMPGTNVFPFVPTAPYEALVFAYQAVDTGIIGSGTINGQGNVPSDSTNRPAGTGTGATRFDGPSYIDIVGPPTTKYSWWTLPSPGNGVALNGTTWYKTPQTDIPTSNGVTRPWLVEFYECGHVTVNGITLVNSPMWNLVFRYSSYITVTNYHVQNYSDTLATIPAPTIGPNTDAMDPVGSSFLTISNIFVQVGDDDIAIKSGLPKDVVSGVPLPPGTQDPNQIGLPEMPSHDITITNVNMTGGHGISIGSEASNGVYNVNIQNINANGSSLTEGLRIKTGRTRGNYATGIHDITINNMIATDVVQPILIYGYYPASGPPNETNATTQCTLTNTTPPCIDPPQAIQPYTPNVYNIFISDLTATGATQSSIIAGVPESCILNVNLNNVSISSSGTPPAGANGTFQLRNMTGTFSNVNMTSTRVPPIPAWVVQENVQVTATGTPGLISPVNTPPLTTTPLGAPCAPYPPGNVYPIGSFPPSS